ncbi:MAG: helix-turn-helix domain-containing protein [Treponema sp.]
MRVLLYDQNIHRNRKLERYLASKAIHITAARCLKDFLLYFDRIAPCIFLIEQSRIHHHKLHVQDIVNFLGLSATVILYAENPLTHHLKFKFMDFRIFHLTFQKEHEETITIAHLKKSLSRLQKLKDGNTALVCETIPHYYNPHTSLYEIAQLFSEPLKQLTIQLLEHEEGLSLQEIIKILNPKNKKNESNYAQTVIHKLRVKLAQTVGSRYMIYCRNHIYRLMYCERIINRPNKKNPPPGIEDKGK